MRKSLSSLLMLALAAAPAAAAKIGDVTRIQGQRTNTLTGLGLVYGLKGTGDGGSFAPSIRSLATMLSKFSNAATAAELGDVKNVALVALTVTVPQDGARNGDHLDVYVSSINASSIKGGRLFVSPLTGPVADIGIFATAEGSCVIEDTTTPTVAVIRGGCTMEKDIVMTYVKDNRFTLTLDDSAASFTTASRIAQVINEDNDGAPIATALNPRTVVVTIPPAERARPDGFIARVQTLPAPTISTEARVTINERTGTIVITGDVEISPAVISHKGLTIQTTTPPLPPSVPQTSEKVFVGIDPQNEGGAKLQDLLKAFDQIKVPAPDRIAILRELHRAKKIHAKLVME